jgi:hypothetical protein
LTSSLSLRQVFDTNGCALTLVIKIRIRPSSGDSNVTLSSLNISSESIFSLVLHTNRLINCSSRSSALLSVPVYLLGCSGKSHKLLSWPLFHLSCPIPLHLSKVDENSWGHIFRLYESNHAVTKSSIGVSCGNGEVNPSQPEE